MTRARSYDTVHVSGNKRGDVGERVNKVTIADVARQAGVSVPTVSKVLNNRDDVSPDTRDLVSGVLATSGYRPRRRQRETSLPTATGAGESDQPRCFGAEVPQHVQ